MVGCSLFALDASGWGFVGLPVLGLALAGVFPTLMLVTPERVGRDRANTMVGYQLAAASAGGAFVPWVGGLLVEWSTLEVIGPVLLVAATVMAVLHRWTLRVAPV